MKISISMVIYLFLSLLHPINANEVKKSSLDLKTKCENGDLGACFEIEPEVSNKSNNGIGHVEDVDPSKKSNGITNHLPPEFLRKCKDSKKEMCIINEVKSMIAQCTNGGARSCLLISNFYKTIPLGEKTSLAYLNISCELKNENACSEMLKIHQLAKNGNSVPGYEAGCKEGVISNCKFKRNDDDEFIGSNRDLKKCINGDHSVCNGNYMYLLKNEKYTQALKFLEPACKKNDFDACLLIGSYYTQINQLEKSKPYFVKSCGANLYKGCLGAGIVSKSQNDKIKFFEKACLGKESFGCSNIGDIYFNKKAYDLSVANYDKGCLLNNIESCEKKCTALANLNTSGNDIIICLNTACNQGGSQSCEAKNTILSQLNKSSEEYNRKLRMLEEANAEDKRRRDLVNDLSAAANQLGKSIAGGQQNNSSINTYSGSGEITCGIKPIPNMGCQIGRCISGNWEQICNTCGIKPIPQIGCQIGRCVNGNWEQICNTCGIKPIPRIGCRVENCVNGYWEQVCN